MKTNTNSSYQDATLKRHSFWSALTYALAVLKQIRCHQWVKNSFLFIPAFFAGTIFDLQNLWLLTLGFFAFSMGASTIYIINDLADIEKDRQHPKKKFRPIASGKISVFAARLMLTFTLSVAIIISLFLPYQFGIVLAAYILMNFAYCFKLKHVAFLDIIIIASGFLLRVVAGGFIVQVPITSWLVLIVFLLSLFLAFAKRRDDVLLFEKEGKEMRKCISGYNLIFVDASMAVLLAITVVCYIMYTVSPEVIARIGTEHLYITAFPVLIGVLRYLQLTFVYQGSGSPTELLLKDTFLQIVILIWLGIFGYVLYC